MTIRDPAERAGRAAKTARRLRKERERVMGWAGAVLLAIPLLFAAVWSRTEVGAELRRSDSLYALRDSLEYELVRADSRRTRLLAYDTLVERLEDEGFRVPRPDEVVWVPVDGSAGRGE